MRKYFFTLILLLLLMVPRDAAAKLKGKELIDSLLRELPVVKEDTSKVWVYLLLGREYANTNADSGISSAQKGLALSEKIGWKWGVSAACSRLAMYYFTRSDYKTALEYNFRGLKVAEESDDKKTQAKTFISISNIYHRQKENGKALTYLKKAAALFEKVNDAKGQAVTYTGLGNVYTEDQKFDSAISYHSWALNIHIALQDTESIGKCYANIGNAYQMQGDYPKALEAGLKSLNYQERTANLRYQAIDLGNIGEAYLGIARDTGKHYKSDFPLPSKREALAKSIDYLARAIAMSKNLEDLETVLEFSKALSDAYTLAGENKKAMASFKEYATLKDSVFSTSNKIDIARQETKRETELKEKEIEISRLSAEKKQEEQALFLVGIGLLLIVVVIVLRNYNKQKQENLIKEGLLRQKDMLMKEIHHRVKNNLQVISTLLDLQLMNVTDATAKDAMTESTTRVRSISLIHQQLYLNDNISAIEFSKFASDLLRLVSSLYNKTGQKVAFDASLPEHQLDVNTAVPLGLMLNELMVNSYKYAFGNGNDGTISIVLNRQGANYELEYKDSGPGLVEESDIHRTKSLGMKLISSLSKQIGGNFRYDAVNKSFVITFKDEASRKLID